MSLLDIFTEEPQVLGFRELSWRGTTVVVDRTFTDLSVHEDGEQVASLAVIDGRLEPAYDDEPVDPALMTRVRAVLARSITPEIRALAGPTERPALTFADLREGDRFRLLGRNAVMTKADDGRLDSSGLRCPIAILAHYPVMVRDDARVVRVTEAPKGRPVIEVAECSREEVAHG